MKGVERRMRAGFAGRMKGEGQLLKGGLDMSGSDLREVPGGDEGIAGALEWARKYTTPPSVEVVQMFGRHRTLQVCPGGGAPAKTEYEQVPFVRDHAFSTLDGLVGYLRSEHCKEDRGVVFVQPGQVLASLTYGAEDKDSMARMALTDSEEFAALDRLFVGVGQQALWEFLVGRLYKCVDEALLNSISSICSARKRSDESSIAASGIVSRSAGESVSLVVGGQKAGDPDAAVEMGLDWMFKVRLWEPFDREYEIPTRLVVREEMKPADGGVACLEFKFVPRRLEKILRGARLDLAEEIRARLAKEKGAGGVFSVFEGVL